MKRILYSLLLLSAVLHLYAADRNIREMQNIAKLQLSGQGRDMQTLTIETLMDEPNYCVLGAEGFGFVVVRRNESSEPVLAYSQSTFPKDNMPDGLKWWLAAVAASLENAAESQPRPITGGYTEVPNFVPAKWGQSDPYNSKAPKVQGSAAPSGCVATAMAQALYCLKYPARGIGEGWYTVGGGTYQQTDAISSTYRWDLMRDTYPSSSLFLEDEEVEAIATLLYECGLSSKMHYGADGSGAYSFEAAHGLITNFQFDSLSVRYYEREFFTDEEWMQLIYNELEARRPVLYGAQDINGKGGHAFLFSGMDAQGRIYVNWGWNGSGNGYFSMTDLNPAGILGASSGTIFHFNASQDMIIGLRCNPIPTDDEYFQSLLYTSAGYTISSSQGIGAVEQTIGNIYNLSLFDFEGALGLYFEKEDDTDVTYFYPLDGDVQIKRPDAATGRYYGTGLANTRFFSIGLTHLSPGVYRAYAASKDKRDKKPQIIRVSGKGAVYFSVNIAPDHSVTVSEAQIATSALPVMYNKTETPIEFLNLQGLRVGNRGKGLLIRRQGGKVTKILLK